MSDHVTLREIVTNLLYPPRCLLCGTLCGWEELLCESCQKQQPQAGEFFWEPEVFGCRGILWCARYEGAFRAGMEQLKFEGVRESLPLFGGMLTEAVRQSGLLPRLTAVTYVPMPPERERHRGYNQSKLLAQYLAGELGLPLREGVPESGDKVTRAEPFSAQWLGLEGMDKGNVDVLIAPWNEMYFNQVESFPESKFKDMVDASSSAFTELESGNTYSAPPTDGGLSKESYWRK